MMLFMMMMIGGLCAVDINRNVFILRFPAVCRYAVFVFFCVKFDNVLGFNAYSVHAGLFSVQL